MTNVKLNPLDSWQQTRSCALPQERVVNVYGSSVRCSFIASRKKPPNKLLRGYGNNVATDQPASNDNCSTVGKYTRSSCRLVHLHNTYLDVRTTTNFFFLHPQRRNSTKMLERARLEHRSGHSTLCHEILPSPSLGSICPLKHKQGLRYEPTQKLSRG